MSDMYCELMGYAVSWMPDGPLDSNGDLAKVLRAHSYAMLALADAIRDQTDAMLKN